METLLILSVYFAGVFENISMFIAIFTLAILIGYGVNCMLYVSSEEDVKIYIPKKIAITALIVLGLSSFIPSKSTVYLMAGLSQTDEVIETINPIATKAIKLLNQELAELLKEK